MRMEITEDSPILIKIIPESVQEIFDNGGYAQRLLKMKIPYKCDLSNGALILNIDPTNPNDFTDHEAEDETSRTY